MQEARDRPTGAGRHSQMAAATSPSTPPMPYSLFPPQQRRGHSASYPSPALTRPVSLATPVPAHSGHGSGGGGGHHTATLGTIVQQEPYDEQCPMFVQYNATPPLNAPIESPKKPSFATSKSKKSKRRKGRLRSALRGIQERQSRLAHVSMRALHVLSHMALCAVVLYIMFRFLAMPTVVTTRNARLNAILTERNNLNRKEAFGLVAVLSMDVLLDLYGLWVCRSEWSAPALVARLVVGGGYITMFVVYYALGGRVFPLRFTFFGLRPSFAAPFIYLFMWTLGTWNVLWVCMYREQLRGIRETPRDSSGETGLGGSGFRSQDNTRAQQHARKDSAGSVTSVWRRQWPFGKKGTMDGHGHDHDHAGDAATRGPNEPYECRGDEALPPGYLDSIRLSQWRRDRNPWDDGGWERGGCEAREHGLTNGTEGVARPAREVI